MGFLPGGCSLPRFRHSPRFVHNMGRDSIYGFMIHGGPVLTDSLLALLPCLGVQPNALPHIIEQGNPGAARALHQIVRQVEVLSGAGHGLEQRAQSGPFGFPVMDNRGATLEAQDQGIALEGAKH